MQKLAYGKGKSAKVLEAIEPNISTFLTAETVTSKVGSPLILVHVTPAAAVWRLELLRQGDPWLRWLVCRRNGQLRYTERMKRTAVQKADAMNPQAPDRPVLGAEPAKVPGEAALREQLTKAIDAKDIDKVVGAVAAWLSR